MTFYQTLVIAFLGSIAPTIAAVAALLQSKKNAVKADEIHVLVNSNLTKVKNDLEIANDHILSLQETVKSLQNTVRALLERGHDVIN